MNILRSLTTISVFYILLIPQTQACTGGTNTGTLSPTLAYQTVVTSDGEYYTMTVNCGQSYHFDFCNNGGSAGSLYPEITILNSTGTTELQIAAYNGTCAELNWTSNFSGTIRILITDSGCFSNGTYSGTMAYNVSGTDCWTLNGNAQYITIAGEQCIQLTAASNGQLGCAWNGSQIDFSGDFTLTLDYYFGNNTSGADGNTFTFQSNSSTVCGTDGGQMGAGGLVNALSIEFDTYDNDSPAHVYDIACDHIAVEIDGNMQNVAPLCGPICAKPSGAAINDGGTYNVEIDWNATTQQLDIYFDNVLRLSCVNDFVTNAFAGNNMVYWGATSSTGGLNNQQYFCPSTVVLLPAEMVRFENNCVDNLETIEWETASERNLDYFRLEYTYNGLVFYPLTEVDAVGNSQVSQVYNYTVSDNDPKQRYYRIKAIDVNGAFEYSDIISSVNCKKQSLIEQLIQSDGIINVVSTSNINIDITNQLGQHISFIDADPTGKKCIINTDHLAKGIYYLRVSNTANQQEVVKIVVAH